MLALCPEVLDYIIKTHSVSAEHSTLTQIRAACEDHERSNEYGKQLAATQTRLSGPRASSAQQPTRAIANARGAARSHRPPQRASTSSHNNNDAQPASQPHGEGPSKTAPPRATPKPDSRPKPALRQPQQLRTPKVSCYICGGPHYARDCPPDNRKAARGYAVRIAEEGAPEPLEDVNPEHQPTNPVPDDENARSPEPDIQGSDGDHDEIGRAHV